MNDFTLMPSPSMDAPVVLKWVGSKGPLAPHICSLVLPLLQERGGRYHEPFAGSLAVFFHLRSLGWEGLALLSDALSKLINFYEQLREDPIAVFAACAQIDAEYKKHTFIGYKTFYLHQRELLNSGEGEPLERAARFTWINHRAYNGLWRTNKDGAMTTDWGGERTYLPSFTRMKEAAKALSPDSKILLHSCDFERTIELAGPKSVIYADPPYAQGYRYYAGSFKSKDQERLAECLHAAYERGAAIIASNADTPQVRELYSWAELRPLSLQYSIGGAVHKTGKEVLIVGVKR